VIQHFGDRLVAAIKEKNTPVCVGLDPVYDRLPADITDREGFNDPSSVECAVDAIGEFCRRVIKVVAPLVPAVKINSAFFERYYASGLDTYYGLVEEARSKGLIVIGDVKRGDVGHSAGCYAKAHLADPELADAVELMIPDAVTVNAYLGLDGVKPFIDAARADGKGVFVLVQTSNESASELQGLALENGGTVAEHVARTVHEWSNDHGLVGESGFSSVGAVVAPRDVEGTARLRGAMPNCMFLVPGFGAQGRGPEDVAVCFKSDGSGALVTASRSVIYAYEDMKYIERYASEWEKCVEHACRDLVESIRTVAVG
jgi:orotidine-5'-phosphate decarboxylase